LRADRLRALWQEHRDVLLNRWLEEHPGRRPCAWWRLEAPEPRRKLSGSGVLVTERYRNLRVQLDHGVPAYFEIDATDPPRYESEAAYLSRLGELTPLERERLPETAFEAELILR
jgi:hypothetical protein